SWQMENQMQPLGGEVEELASSRHRLDLQAVQRGQRWVVGLERAEGNEINSSNRVPDTLLGEKPRQRFHLRHLGHGPIMATPSSADCVRELTGSTNQAVAAVALLQV